MQSPSGAQHALRAGDYQAFVTSIGASLRSLTYRGSNLVVPFSAHEVRPAYRGATLAPWPNRVVDGKYRFGDVKHQLPLTEPNRSHALHGLAAWRDYETVGKGPSHVMLRTVIQPQTGYPWRVVVDTTFTLDSDGLRQSVTARNETDTTAPWGTAPHPYLVAGDGTIDEWILHLAATHVLDVTSDRLVPTDLQPVATHQPDRFDYRAPRLIGDSAIDHAYTGLSRNADDLATVRLTRDDGPGVEMTWDTSCPWVQIHTADHPDPAITRRGLAVEPMTCAPDALNDDLYPYDTGLIRLEPGATHTASWRIAAIT
ncbi:aldose 1-epimerase family protein [Microbacterium sp. ET2]|uniref:aldose 1-epimerase family protein n=1 Tax=Microbacterium albipurpureum TaxID=3050384 RepID=UPI00259CBA8F|nr:aldose 1-epimerase family protein [Microbacterium sp. ET2 (Ac-2212)]WJL97045.1 aldose 1-epimerase family protein [Microbacterium sp. ET2 (Ac-2212)]